MKSATVGARTSKAEVTTVSPQGIWVLVRGKECFLPYDEFPWFRNARLQSIFDVKIEHNKSLRWPELDVDLEITSLSDLDSYPLVYR